MDLLAQARDDAGGQHVSCDFDAAAFACKQRGPGLWPIFEAVGKRSGEKLEGLSGEFEFGLVNTLKAPGESPSSANVPNTHSGRVSGLGRLA